MKVRLRVALNAFASDRLFDRMAAAATIGDGVDSPGMNASSSNTISAASATSTLLLSVDVGSADVSLFRTANSRRSTGPTKQSTHTPVRTEYAESGSSAMTIIAS